MAPLRPPASLAVTNTRERLLVMGGANMGKSYSAYTIARLAHTTGSDARFYIIDTDESVGIMLSDPAFTSLWADNQLVNIDFLPATNWDELMAAMAKFQGVMRPQDWLVLDMLSPAWSWCQEAYTQRIWGQDLDEFYLMKRQEMRAGDKKLNAFEGWKDYTVINGMFSNLQDMILRSPGNIYCTSEVKTISGDNVEKDTKLMFGPHGVVPVGQKRTPHLFSTIIWMTSTIPGVREAITIKDRSRPEMHGLEIVDFAQDYLVGIGKWRTGLSPAEALAAAKAKKTAT